MLPVNWGSSPFPGALFKAIFELIFANQTQGYLILTFLKLILRPQNIEIVESDI